MPHCDKLDILVTERGLGDNSAPITPSTAQHSSTLNTSTAGDNIEDGQNLPTDDHPKINANPAAPKKKVKLARINSTDKEHHVSWLAPTSPKSTPQCPPTSLPSSQVHSEPLQIQDQINKMSSLSIQSSTNKTINPNIFSTSSTQGVFVPSTSSSAVHGIQNNQQPGRQPSTVLSHTGVNLMNSACAGKDFHNNQNLFSGTSSGMNQRRVSPISSNSLFGSSCLNNAQHNQPTANNNSLHIPVFNLPFTQSSHSIACPPSQALPHLSSASFLYNNTTASNFHSQLHNHSGYYNQHPSDPFTSYSTMPSSIAAPSYSNSTVDLTLSNSQIAARQVISKDLPVFNGNPEEWPVFITNYVQSTERCGFTEQENLIRLQKSLKGQALEAVRGNLMVPGTVKYAVETLRMLYGRPEIIHHTLQKKLKEHPVVRKEKLETLIHFALAVQNYRTTMQAMGLSEYLNDPMLLNELVDKLPSDLKLDWGRHRFASPRADIAVFDGWLFSLAACASHVTSFVSTCYDECKKHTKERINLHDVTFHNKGNTITTTACCKCAQNHRLAECPEFLLFTVNERWNFIKENNLCVRCFKKHSVRRCYSKKLCGVDKCTKPHNPLLHKSNSGEITNKTSEPSEQNLNLNSSVLFHARENKTLFRYVPVTIYGKSQSLNTFALIDEGSSCTLIENELAMQLELSGPKEELCLQWTGDITQIDDSSRIVSLKISSQSEQGNKMEMRNVRTIANLGLPIQTLKKKDIECCEHLANLPIMPYTSAKARILIGIDNAKLCVPLEIREGTNNELIATRSRIGWGVYGRPPADMFPIHRVMHVCPSAVNNRLDDLLQHYFSLDSVGISMSKDVLRSKGDARAIKIMESKTKYIQKEKIWETGLLWKYDNINLPDSYSMACRRLFCLEAKMNKNPELKSFLLETLHGYKEKGYIRKLEENEISSGGKSWYIPIFTVTNKNKNKKRIVWDAAASVENTSLNTMLLKGPDLLNNLLGILLRFRERPIAISGDIREMFHQIRIAKEDQQAQQFLWRSGNNKDKIDVYVMTVMTFGASCSPSLANFIKNKNAERLACQHPKAVHSILNNMFVDDWLQSLNSEEEMIQIAKTVRYIHEEGGFEMRNWLSNSAKVLNALKETTTHMKKSIEDPEGKFEKVLGMWWMPTNDELTFIGKFDADVFNEDIVPTKRSVLRVIMSIFDPLGLLGHYVVHAKIIMQEIWRSGVNWDEPLCDKECEKWRTWVSLLPSLTNIRIPRCHGHSSNVQIHTFVDASVDAYAAAVYLRVELEGNVKCSLIASKTRVAPLKPISIPKLELMAAVIGLRLSNFITREMSIEIHRKVFWSDSKDVLYWIRSDARKFQQFVAVRVGEILEGSLINQWRWVPSAQNVADEGTKWNNMPNLRSDSRWFTGPPFLYFNESEWPISDLSYTPHENTEVNCHIKSRKSEFPLFNLVPDPNRISKWEILRLSQNLVFKFIILIMGKRAFKDEIKPFTKQEGIYMSELFIFKACQEQAYPEETSDLKLKKNLKPSSPLFKCSPYLDQMGILRVNGRINAVLNVPTDMKRPIILPKNHRTTFLLLDFYHRK
ncbi:uncharacterized protein LOC142231088 [Haematobia irritans]|uniref:uncharacterized protein LOC142231088 n=1 Tax=Haematobia irritans TaxID=7368 RepID=UPI003F4FB013